MSDNENPKQETEITAENEPAAVNETEQTAQAAANEAEQPAKPFSGALEWAGSLVYAMLAMLAVSLFLFRAVTVSGDSMNNTLLNNDRVISTNFFYTPGRGDIVVVQADKIQNYATGKYGEPIIKRVIAVEGDTLKFDFTQGKIYLRAAGERDFSELSEDYIKEPSFASLDLDTGVEYTVPDGCVFVMGDNRNRSLDSRSNAVGFVDTDLIMGKAFVRLFPLDSFGLL